MNCSYCNKPVVLRPSAAERAAKYGGKPSDYTALFPNHAECSIAARDTPPSRVSVKDLHPSFQQMEMHRLRTLALKAFRGASGKAEADHVNRLNEEELLKLIHNQNLV
jgi:hypothetical protein